MTNPATAPSERRFAEIAARTPHFVLSRTLRAPVIAGHGKKLFTNVRGAHECDI